MLQDFTQSLRTDRLITKKNAAYLYVETFSLTNVWYFFPKVIKHNNRVCVNAPTLVQVWLPTYTSLAHVLRTPGGYVIHAKDEEHKRNYLWCNFLNSLRSNKIWSRCNIPGSYQRVEETHMAMLLNYPLKQCHDIITSMLWHSTCGTYVPHNIDTQCNILNLVQHRDFLISFQSLYIVLCRENLCLNDINFSFTSHIKVYHFHTTWTQSSYHSYYLL